MSFAGQTLFSPSNRCFDMHSSKHRKPTAARNAIQLAEIHESGANSNLPSLIQQQLPWAAMLCETSFKLSVKLFAVFSSAQHSILSSLLHTVAMTTVRNLQRRPFSQSTLEEKLEVKCLGLNYWWSQACFYVASPKRGTESAVDLLALVTLEKFITLLPCFLGILNEEKLGPSLMWTTDVVVILRIAWRWLFWQDRHCWAATF